MSRSPKRFHLGKIVPAIVVVVLVGYAVAAGAATGRVAPRQPNGIGGVVASIGGVTTPGCLASDTGTFTLTVSWGRATTAVDVTEATTYTDSAVTMPTYANVCVGSVVRAFGTFSAGTLTASSVTIVPPPQVKIRGIVASVGGSSTAGCLSSGTVPFTMVGERSLSITTVDLTSTTTYTDAAVTTPGYGYICVAGYVEADGTLSSGTLTAASVTILPTPSVQADGIVASVDGSSTAPACLTSDSESFTLVGGTPLAITDVAVSSTTTYKDHAVSSPGFGDVCVGSQLRVTGSFSSGTLTATGISIGSPFMTPDPGGHGGPGHNPRPGGKH